MAVEGFTGRQGEGKTYSAVEHVASSFLELHDLAEKKGTQPPELWSNLPLAGAQTFRNWDEFKEMLGVAASLRLRVIVLVDELGVWMPARMWSKMDPRVMTWLQQRRRTGAGCDFYWTAPSIMHVDTMVRDITQIVWMCKRFGGSEYSHDGGRPPLLFHRRGFDPIEVARVSEKQKAKKLGAAWRPFSKDVASLYETDVVDLSTPMDADPEGQEFYAAADRREPGQRVDVAVKLERADKKRGRR